MQDGTKKRPIKLQETASENKDSNTIQKSKHACIVEAHESTRMRLEFTLPKDHEDRTAKKGYNSFSHYTHAHNCIPKTVPAWQLDKVKSTKVVILESQRKKNESPLCYFDGHLSFQKCRVGTKVSKVQTTSRVPR